ncbi:aminotransferase class V-fold PLP-dependent enzyme [Fodinicola feengrottensis]|uniref:aminotransferase class V-fold PLP-dependent enzyme n=1 Tax=Fodinicola feengrottensis TaxID=435914 RepID=UPI002441F2ED|nr:aminotransferase class V-fold PLP-dependent enzyme [Fodinicola feengrottensis]
MAELAARILRRLGVQVRLVPYEMTGAGEIDVEDLLGKVTHRTRIVVATHIHHVFGSLSALDDLNPSIVRCLDCSQSVGHVDVDVQQLGVDFAVFSAHKLFGSPGAGVLYCHRRVHDRLDPFLPGGSGRTTAGLPALLEGGTPNIPAVLSLGKAIDFVAEVGIDRIAEHVRLLTRLVVERLRTVPRLEFTPGPAWSRCAAGYGIVSFRLPEISASDVGFALSSENFYVRTGNHCLPEGADFEDSVRVSLHLYNTEAEVERFADFLGRVAKGMV